MTEAEQVAAVLALLNVDASPVAFTLADIEEDAALPTYYVEVGLTRRFGGAYRVAGGVSTRGYRLTTRVVALDESNAREIQRRVTVRLEDAYVGDSTPIEFETADEIRPDNGWYSGLTTWTYAI